MNIEELKKLKEENDKKSLELESTFWKEALEFQKTLKMTKKILDKNEDKEQEK